MKSHFTRNLLEWNARDNRRSMPWKGETDPYRIWLSEIILQQTRVEQGLAYYDRFIRAFPDVHALASAKDGDIYKMWEGLGYYTRCKNLIASARFISQQLNGMFPGTYEEIRKLKGVGQYTAAAIASFAFNEKRAVVDGNVQRVLARYFGISTPVDTSQGKILFNTLAQELIDENSPAAYNQAIMDFGATVCKPRKPLCEQCIQQPECEAFNNKFVHEVPVKEKTLNRKSRWLYYFIIEKEDGVYIRKREDRDIWQNLHEFVLLESNEENPSIVSPFLEKLLQHQSYTLISSSEIHSQQLTHQRINGRFFVIQLEEESRMEGNYMLVKKNNLNAYAFPKFINSFLETHFR